MQIEIHNILLEAIQGDISNQHDLKAVVNAANAQLQSGGGVAGAIHRAAGPDLARECRPMAPIAPGEAVITGGHNLPNAYVIHCLGPVFGQDKPEDELLSECFRNALKLADKHQIESIGFPAISTGAFGYPLMPATEIAWNTVKETLPDLKYVQLIRMVLFNPNELRIHQEKLASLKGS